MALLRPRSHYSVFIFHLDPFLLLKTKLFFLPVHITPFLNKNGYLSSAVFTLVLKNGSDHLLLSLLSVLCFLYSGLCFGLCLLSAFLNSSVFGVHITVTRFCLAPFLFSPVFASVFV